VRDKRPVQRGPARVGDWGGKSKGEGYIKWRIQRVVASRSLLRGLLELATLARRVSDRGERTPFKGAVSTIFGDLFRPRVTFRDVERMFSPAVLEAF
jgi:hypothetical protein